MSEEVEALILSFWVETASCVVGWGRPSMVSVLVSGGTSDSAASRSESDCRDEGFSSSLSEAVNVFSMLERPDAGIAVDVKITVPVWEPLETCDLVSSCGCDISAPVLK